MTSVEPKVRVQDSYRITSGVPERSKALQLGLLAAFGAAVLAGVLLAADPVFWDRFAHAYTFDSYVEHPFPSEQRLYPQERVRGRDQPRPVPHAPPGRRSVRAEALAAAAAFAEESDSTSLIVYHRGYIQLERYWHGAGPRRRVYSFSMHKSVVAMLVGIAINEGLIAGVDDPLAKYLPQWRGEPRAAVTLRHALQMNSGFETMRFPRQPFSKHVRRQIGTDLAATALSFRLQDAPGTVFSYNGVNPTLLVMVLERASGRRYAAYLSEKLWRPLGNGDAAVWLDHAGGLARGATALYAVPMDWLRLGVMFLDGGRVEGRQIVPESWLREMRTPSSTNPLYGYLIWVGSQYVEKRTLESFKGFAAVAEAPLAASDVIYFDGLGGQRVYIIPSHDLVIVRTGLLSREWDDTRLPNLIVGGISEPASTSQGDE